MLSVKIIAVGNLKEEYWRDAAAEYIKRLGAFCSPEVIQIKETRLPESPSDGEIAAALADEGKRILAAIPPRSRVVALCVEGKQVSSEELAGWLDSAAETSGSVAFIIGGSFGLSDEVKRAATDRISFSRMTFPHQLMRVILLEQTYRAFNIIKGTKYHK